MKNELRMRSTWMFSCLTALLLTSALSSTALFSQTAGNNAVCPNTTACSSLTTASLFASPAFIDAKQFQTGTLDLCGTLHLILTMTVPTPFISGSVIDARGITTGLTCSSSPWGASTGYANVPSTILLPAQTIVIPSTWILPNGTKLIGESVNAVPSATSAIQTTIQACTTGLGCTSNFSAGTPMIQFGTNTGTFTKCPGAVPTCTGISVEQLTLNGSALTINGIENQTSQDLSYVDHVYLYHIAGVGFDVSSVSSSSAQGSGPYSNITFDSSGVSGAVCAQIGVSATRGVQGLTCISDTSNAGNAIYLDASNTSLQDIHIFGFYNGIVVGSRADAHSDVLLNVYGDTVIPPVGATVNVINVSTANSVTNLSMIGIANPLGGGLNHTLDDGVTGTLLTDKSIAMYILGKAASGGYSRFTTSQNTVTWVAGVYGAMLPSSCSAANTGSLFSDTKLGNLYVCESGTWQQIP